MFFFFVGGLQQEIRQVLKSGVGKCTFCANNRVDLVNYDKVLKLFFVPVWRWPAKDPLLYCGGCKNFFPYNYSLPPGGDGESASPTAVTDALRCRFCDRSVEADFRFCPFCGSELWREMCQERFWENLKLKKKKTEGLLVVLLCTILWSYYFFVVEIVK